MAEGRCPCTRQLVTKQHTISVKNRNESIKNNSKKVRAQTNCARQLKTETGFNKSKKCKMNIERSVPAHSSNHSQSFGVGLFLKRSVSSKPAQRSKLGIIVTSLLLPLP
jgi:hypothetical protein